MKTINIEKHGNNNIITASIIMKAMAKRVAAVLSLVA